MVDYMDPRNWDNEDKKACKLWAACMGVCLALLYFTMWIFY